jgi:ketosteroid isomerase-like protein
MLERAKLQTDEDEILRANQAFYEALRSLDLAQMDAIWLQEDWVRCLHPGGELHLGWEEVRKSWADIFHSTSHMVVSISRPLAQVLGECAWVSCLENATVATSDSFSTAVIEATNIFVRRHERWLMVHRHTSLLPGRVPAGTSRTVQ